MTHIEVLLNETAFKGLAQCLGVVKKEKLDTMWTGTKGWVKS